MLFVYIKGFEGRADGMQQKIGVPVVIEGYSIKKVFSLSGPHIGGANVIPGNPHLHPPHSTSPGSLSDDCLNFILDSFWPSILLLLT